MGSAYDAPKRRAKPKVSPPKAVRGTRVTILGCGTSTGVPLLACKCATCLSRNPKNKRLRASVTIQVGSKVFLIDTSPDLRTQALRSGLQWIDAVLFTHPHADHIHGLDELRSYNYLMARTIDCYGNRWTMNELKNRFDYIFKKTQEGGGKPHINLNVINGPRTIAGVRVVPLELIHGSLPVLGYRIGSAAYITDCSDIPEKTLRRLHNLEVLVLDCLRPRVHPTHLNIERAIGLAKTIGARRTVFTHMGHEIEYSEFARSLPRGMQPAYDGLVITV